MVTTEKQVQCFFSFAGSWCSVPIIYISGMSDKYSEFCRYTNAEENQSFYAEGLVPSLLTFHWTNSNK